jgi:hypothetical protein
MNPSGTFFFESTFFFLPPSVLRYLTSLDFFDSFRTNKVSFFFTFFLFFSEKKEREKEKLYKGGGTAERRETLLRSLFIIVLLYFYISILYNLFFIASSFKRI